MANTNPLVSVIVVTYNSSSSICATLDSIAAQTYHNIELVVSDDHSTDNTAEKVNEWLRLNGERFHSACFLETPKNTGPSGNYNRAIAKCNGDFIKECDGDDQFFPDCIQTYVEFVHENPKASFIFGKGVCFGNNPEAVLNKQKVFDNDFFDWTVNKQLEYLYLCGAPIFSSSFFYNRLRWNELGLTNDERISFYEDRPKWINILEKGEKLYCVNKATIRYCVADGSLSNSIGCSPLFQNALALFDKYYKIPYLSKESTWFEVLRMKLLNRAELTKNIFLRVIGKIIKNIYGPMDWTHGHNVSINFWIK